MNGVMENPVHMAESQTAMGKQVKKPVISPKVTSRKHPFAHTWEAQPT